MALLVPSDAPLLAELGFDAADVEAVCDQVSALLREAINAHWVCPEALADFPSGSLGDEVRETVEAHGVAIARQELLQSGGSSNRGVEVRGNRARGWAKRVREGVVDLSPLERRASAAQTAGGPLLTVVGTDEPRLDERVLCIPWGG